MDYTADDVAAAADLDPANDSRFPRIAPWTPAADPSPSWPGAWGGEITERDAVGLYLDDLTVPGPRGASPILVEDDAIPLCAECRAVVDGCAVCGHEVAPRNLGGIPRGAAVNLNDYRLPSAKGWGTGWPQCGGAAGNLVIVTADRSGVRFSVHRRISVLFDHLIDRMESRGYLCRPGQCGAYNCRAIGGTSVSSNHAWALAGDINWTDNPFTTTGQHTMPLWVPREVFNPYGFAWGGDYKGSKKDYMHVEFMGSPAQADEQTARVLAGGGGGGGGPTPAGGRWLELTTPNMTGDDVRAVQRVLRAWYGLPASFVDGVYGPGTVEYVKRAQAGTPPPPVLPNHGRVGPQTLAKLGIG